MLKYIYSGITKNLSRNAEDVFMLADKYEIERLKKHCIVSLASNINEKNFFKVVAVAYLYSS